MFDANGLPGGTDGNGVEDTRLYGYDPMIPPAVLQEEIPSVCPSLTTCISSLACLRPTCGWTTIDVLVRRIIENSSIGPSRNPKYPTRER